MAQVELKIEEVKNVSVAIELFNKERIGFTIEMNKNSRALKRIEKEFEAELISLRELFFEVADKKLVQKSIPKAQKTKQDIVDENKPVFKKYVFIRKGRGVEAKRDKDGNMVELLPGQKSAAGEFAFSAIPDNRLEEFNEAYKKLLETPYKVELHQIAVMELEEKLQLKEEKTGTSIDGNITEPLMDVIFVEEVQR